MVEKVAPPLSQLEFEKVQAFGLDEGHPDRGDRPELLVDDGETLFARWLAAHDAVIREEQAERDIAIVKKLYPLGSEVLGNAPMVIAVALRSQSFTGTEEQNG